MVTVLVVVGVKVVIYEQTRVSQAENHLLEFSMRGLTGMIPVAVAVRVRVLVAVVVGGALTTKHEQALDTWYGRLDFWLMEVQSLAKVG